MAGNVGCGSRLGIRGEACGGGDIGGGDDSGSLGEEVADGISSSVSSSSRSGVLLLRFGGASSSSSSDHKLMTSSGGESNSSSSILSQSVASTSARSSGDFRFLLSHLGTSSPGLVGGGTFPLLWDRFSRVLSLVEDSSDDLSRCRSGSRRLVFRLLSRLWECSRLPEARVELLLLSLCRLSRPSRRDLDSLRSRDHGGDVGGGGGLYCIGSSLGFG